jgi:hypothetical protein
MNRYRGNAIAVGGRPSPPDASGLAGAAAKSGLAAMTALLGLALAANSVLGPLVKGVIDYRFGRSMINQAIGLDAVALLIGTPLALVASWLTYRRHLAAPCWRSPPLPSRRT